MMKKAMSILLLLAMLATMFAFLTFGTSAQKYDWIPASAIDHSSYDYTFAALPDTQYLARDFPAKFPTMMNYIKENAAAQKIKFVMHLGDITDQNTTAQWNTAKNAIKVLNGVVPYSLSPGNHDYNRSLTYRNLSGFEAAFPISEYKSLSTFGGSYSASSMANTYHKITAGNVKYLILALEFAPRNEVVAWANNIVAANPDYNVIITTHAYMGSSGTYVSKNGWYDSSTYNFATTSGNLNDGTDLWTKLASKHKNIKMVLCGHVSSPELVVRRDRGESGNSVYQILADAQSLDLDYGGLGMIMFMRFSNGGTKVELQYYSTVKNMYLKKSNIISIDTLPDFNSPLVFTEMHVDTPSTDITEYFEIMNISDYPVDLYDYQMMYASGAGRGPKRVSRTNYFSDSPGAAILDPGELAIVWVVSSPAYANGFASVAGGEPVYDMVRFRSHMTSLYGANFNPDARVIIMDRTNKSLPIIDDATTAGMTNTGNFNFYLTPRGATDGFGALAVMNVLSTATGLSTHYGMPMSGSVDQYPREELATPSPGSLSANQADIVAAVLPATYSLVITEVYRDTPGGADVTEGFEIMNVSNSPVDLYDFKVWRYHDPANIWENVASATAATAVSANLKGAPLSETPGEFILEPGEIAFCWTVFGDMYNHGYAVKDGGGNPTYNYQMFRDRVLQDQGRPFDPNCLIVPFDTSIGTGRFNTINSYGFRLYLSARSGNIDDAIAIADVIAPTSTQGTSVIYAPSAYGNKVLTPIERLAKPSFSFLTEEQKRLWQVEDITPQYGLVITELCRNPGGSDVTEGFEIMNISDAPIDLYNYKVWRYHDSANDWNTVEATTAETALPANLKSQTLSDTPGQYVLEPGEIAFCWTIFSDMYNNGYASTDGQGNPIYNYSLFRQTVEEQQGVSLPAGFKIIPIDSHIDSSSFNMNNSNRFRLYITPRNGTIDDATAIANVTEVPAVANTSVIYGAPPSGGRVLSVWSNTASRNYSVLNQKQSAAWGLAPEYSLVITEVSRDTPGGADVTEGFEIMNVSDAPIDLYDYKVWRYHDPNNIWENVASATASSAVADYLKGAPLSETRGEFILGPGEIAFVWTVFGDMYTHGYASNDAQGNKIYDYVKFKERVLADQGDAFDPNCLIVPFDTSVGTGRFNTINSYSFRLYITSRTATIDGAIAIADITAPSSTQGTSFVYGPGEKGEPNLRILDRLSPSDYTRLTPAQKKAWGIADLAPQYGLVITEVCRNPGGVDVTEGFEIANLSDAPIDLYDYKIWRYHDPGNSWSVIESVTAESANPSNLRSHIFSDTPGQYVLEPGEIAFCWTIFSDMYNNGYASTDEGGNPVYNYSLFRQTVQQQQGIALADDLKIIPLDSTIGSGRFNLFNSNCFRLYITRRNDTIDDASVIADLTDISPVYDTSTVYGPASSGGPILAVWERSGTRSYSVLTEVQRSIWGIPFSYSLVITEVCRDTPGGADVTEGFEIMNVSDRPIDLYNYKVWRYHDPGNVWANVSGATAASAVAANLRCFNISDIPGQYVLEPGEIAFCWTVFSDMYNHGYAVKDGGGNPTYNFQMFRNRVLADQGAPMDPDCKIIPLDSTLGSGRFNTINSNSFRLYITSRNDNIDGAVAMADITAVTSTEGTSVIYGRAHDGGPLERVLNALAPSDYSRLSPSQVDQWEE